MATFFKYKMIKYNKHEWLDQILESEESGWAVVAALAGCTDEEAINRRHGYMRQSAVGGHLRF
jgi:hypothetical protein